MGFTIITMKHFVNFGIIENIKSSTGKQRVGAGAGLLGLAAAGGYAGYRALKGDSIDLGKATSELYEQAKDGLWNAYQKPSLDSYADYNDLEHIKSNIPQHLQGDGVQNLKEWTEDKFGNPSLSVPQAEGMGGGTDIYRNLHGTVDKVYRDRPNTPRDDIYDAIRHPDLRGEQFTQTGERLKTVLGNTGKTFIRGGRALGESEINVGNKLGDYVGGSLNLGAETAIDSIRKVLPQK